MGPYIADGSSEYFRICNAGKESIALDLKDPKDHALVEKIPRNNRSRYLI